MNEFKHLHNQTPGILRALAIGIPAGFVFNQLHTPIPWMIGPMIAVASLNLMGIQMHSPPYARQIGQVILGSAVSLYFTPPVVAALGGNLPAIAAATVVVFLVGIFGALTLSRASGVDAKSTFFASIPGGAMAMAVLADRYGAQIAPTADFHWRSGRTGPPSRSQFRSSLSGWLLVGYWAKSPKDFNFITAVFWCRFFSVRR